MGHQKHTVTVFAPTMFLTVTIERDANQADEIHIHPGGQGFWIARMLKHLGERPLLCGPLGGEPGQTFLGLLAQWGMDVSPIKTPNSTAISINDRRGGDRVELANSPQPKLSRHELDDAYSRLLDLALGSGICVVTGQSEEIFPIEVYRRMGHDLGSAEVEVIADLHGPELWGFLEGGPIDVLKVSDEDLVCDGLLADVDADPVACLVAIEKLIAAGARAVVLSRQDKPALARFGTRLFEATSPELEPADHRGAGDSMTAGLASARRQNMPVEDMIRLACAAGAANVTRHGLGSADSDLIASLSERVEIRPLAATPA